MCVCSNHWLLAWELVWIGSRIETGRLVRDHYFSPGNTPGGLDFVVVIKLKDMNGFQV